MAKSYEQGELGSAALIAGAVALAGMTIGGYLVGSFIDSRLHTAPTFAIIGLLLGVGVGFFDMYRISVRVMRREDRLRRERGAAFIAAEEIDADDDEEEGTRDNRHENR
jgi:F0F1-type ATP synthase assembly protein I